MLDTWIFFDLKYFVLNYCWNWFSGSREKVENVKKKITDEHNDRRALKIMIGKITLKLSFSSDELKLWFISNRFQHVKLCFLIIIYNYNIYSSCSFLDMLLVGLQRLDIPWFINSESYSVKLDYLLKIDFIWKSL